MTRLNIDDKYGQMPLHHSLDFNLRYVRTSLKEGWEEGHIRPWSTNGPIFGSLPEEQVWMLVPVDPTADQNYQISYYKTTNEIMGRSNLPWNPQNQLIDRQVVKNKGWDGSLDWSTSVTQPSDPQRSVNDIAAIFIRPAYVTNIVQYGLPHSNHSARSKQDIDERQSGRWSHLNGNYPVWMPIMTTLPPFGGWSEDERKDDDDEVWWVMISINPEEWRVGGAWEVGTPEPHAQDLKKMLSDYNVTGGIPGGSGNAWLWNSDPKNPNRWPNIQLEGNDHSIFVDERAKNIMLGNLNPSFYAAINKTII